MVKNFNDWGNFNHYILGSTMLHLRSAYLDAGENKQAQMLVRCERGEVVSRFKKAFGKKDSRIEEICKEMDEEMAHVRAYSPWGYNLGEWSWYVNEYSDCLGNYWEVHVFLH